MEIGELLLLLESAQSLGFEEVKIEVQPSTNTHGVTRRNYRECTSILREEDGEKLIIIKQVP